MPSLVEIGTMVLEKIKKWKVYDDGNNNNKLWSEKLIEPLAQMSLKYNLIKMDNRYVYMIVEEGDF